MKAFWYLGALLCALLGCVSLAGSLKQMSEGNSAAGMQILMSLGFFAFAAQVKRKATRWRPPKKTKAMAAKSGSGSEPS